MSFIKERLISLLIKILSMHSDGILKSIYLKKSTYLVLSSAVRSFVHLVLRLRNAKKAETIQEQLVPSVL